MRLLLASDLHYSAGLVAEMAGAGPFLPSDTYDHAVDGRLVWHNTMLVERMDRMLDGLALLIERERPDLVVLMGDLVNTNWPPNVSAVAARLTTLPVPVRVITGNHDIYLDGPGTRLQDAISPGDFDTGLRHETVGDVDLILLDLFVHDRDGRATKTTDPHDDQAHADYRSQDIAAALALLAAHPDRRFLALGHFPMVTPEARLAAAGRKIGRRWPGGASLGAWLDRPGNLLGIITGHQHFCHFQRFVHGFHWTLPAMVEYPCAVGLLDVNADALRGRIITPVEELAVESLAATRAAWTAGERADREFEIAYAAF